MPTSHDNDNDEFYRHFPPNQVLLNIVHVAVLRHRFLNDDVAGQNNARVTNKICRQTANSGENMLSTAAARLRT